MRRTGRPNFPPRPSSRNPSASMTSSALWRACRQATELSAWSARERHAPFGAAVAAAIAEEPRRPQNDRLRVDLGEALHRQSRAAQELSVLRAESLGHKRCGGRIRDLGQGLDQLDLEVGPRRPDGEHHARLVAQVVDLPRVGLAECHDPLAVPVEPDRDQVRTPIGPHGAEPDDGICPQRGVHRWATSERLSGGRCGAKHGHSVDLDDVLATCETSPRGLDVGRAPAWPDDVGPTLYSARMPPIASVDVPASSANLGSGFDCFAAALSLKMRAELWHGDESGIVLNSRGEGTPRDDEPADDNLLIRAFREGLRISAAPGAASWRLEVSSMIPAARGLGSSAAAIVAGAVLGAAVGRRTVEADELLALAARLEGHPDNVAAALYGGFTVALAETDERIVLRRFRVPEAWIPVAFIPQRESRTHEMRAALPSTISHAVAGRQAGRSALLAAAIMTSDAGLLRAAMADELHQPYRLPLLSGSRELIELAYERGAAGACLSGAGPTVLAICDSPTSAHAVEKAWNAAGVPGMATRLRFDTSGARLVAD